MTDSITWFSKLAGAAIIVLAIIAPISYCAVQEDANRTSLKRACIESKGDWSNTWGGSCSFPKPQ